MLFRLMEAYCDWLKAMDKKSTVPGYQHALGRYGDWLIEHDLDYRKVAMSDLERYQQYLAEDYRKSNGDQLAKTTQGTWLASVKAFYRWMHRSGRSPIDPARKILLPRVSRERVTCDLLSQQEVIAFLHTQSDLLSEQTHGSFYWATEYRNLALLCLALATGRRERSMAHIKVKDLDFDRKEIRIEKEKGRHGRVLPVADWALSCAGDFIEKARPIILGKRDDTGWLFVGQRTERIDKVYLSRLAKRLQQKTAESNPDLKDLPRKRISSHSFRVTFATTLMFLNGCEIRTLNAMLLHRKLSTSAKYVLVETEHLRRACQLSHPRA